ncbi:MAG TPA: sulfotransferase [Rhodanobacteraceae bacterium]|nr:sulfotransferase [Rhodanobacteraceae bacterium]
MDINDRLFALPPADAAKIEARLAALPAGVRELIERAGSLLAGSNPFAAQSVLAQALAAAPDQPDALRLQGLLQARGGNAAAAFDRFEQALRAAPDDAMGYWQYARMREETGDIGAALALRQRAVENLPESPAAWSDLGDHLYRHQNIEAAFAPLERAVELAANFAPALFKLGSAYVACGKAAEGAAMMRRALRCEPAFGAAWLGLVDAKTVSVTQHELAQMRELLGAGSGINAGERTAIEFALAMACERTGNYGEAWQRLVNANVRRKNELRPWSPEYFRERERKAMDVYASPHASAAATALGQHVIFIVGMPRSGTTLVEQILVSHPEVCGAGELPALPQVLTEESSRRKQRYPDWVTDATAADWERLGRRYLELTAAFRRERGFSTDKLPVNWRAIGAIRAMLPGAHVVVCRRDPVENCWSCFKQYFGQGWEFTYDIEDLATFWRGFDQAASHWARRAPQQVREQSYEALTEEPEREMRALLEFCGLPWDAGCLRFHESRRSVRTLSSAQVHLPMYKYRSTAARYGALLDPLRLALGLPAFDGGQSGRS